VIYLYLFWVLTIGLYQFVENPFFVYVGNVLIIFFILVSHKAETSLWEDTYKKLKKDNFLKRYIKKNLVEEGQRPSMKATLYLFYIICLIAERFLYFNVGERFLVIDYTFMQNYQGYFSGMYYSLILLMAADKFKGFITKDNQYRKKYYAKYEDQEDEG